jgi:hypothetical protein
MAEAEGTSIEVEDNIEVLSRPRWEYLTVSVVQRPNHDFLDAYGEEGWELVDVIAIYKHQEVAHWETFFKRPLPDKGSN